MLNKNINQSSHRQAQLIELLGEDLNPTYVFIDDSIDFRNPSKHEGSNLVFFTYSNNFDEKDVKNVAMKTFEDNYNTENLFHTDQTLFDSIHSRYSIKELKEKRSKVENDFEQFKAKNFYNPLKINKISEPHIRNIKIMTGGFIALGGFGAFFGNYKILGIGFMVGCAWSLESGRKYLEKESQNKINSINENMEFYDNFRKNIENSNIEIYHPEEAQKIHHELQDFQGKMLIKSLINSESVNKELTNIYKKNQIKFD